MKAHAAMGLNPTSVATSLSSSNASSYSLLPYVTASTAGVLLAIILRSRSTVS